jgi:type I restriction-modification system DNA methylase subunit
MTSSQQRAALQRQIWAIANDVRGAVDGWDFKQYVLGALFYRSLSVKTFPATSKPVMTASTMQRWTTG